MRKCTTKIIDYFTFDIYVRIYFEASVSLILNSCIETYQANFTTVDTYISYILSILLNIFCLFMIWMSYKTWKRAYRQHIKSYYLKELYDGLKETEYSLIFNYAVLLRRVLMIFFIIYCEKLPLIAKILTFAIIQLMYTVYITCKF